MALRSHLIVSVRATRTEASIYLSICSRSRARARARRYNLLTRPSFRVSSAPLTGTLNAGRPSICLILRFARTLPTRGSLTPLRLRSTRFTGIRLGYLSADSSFLPSRICVINWILMFAPYSASFESRVRDEDHRVALNKWTLSFVNCGHDIT